MAIINPVNNLYYGPNGGIALPGAKFVSTYGNTFTLNATADVYTCPTGKRALIMPFYGANNAGTPTSATMQAKIKVSGNYYNISAATTASQSSVFNPPNPPIILEAGESISVTNTTSNNASFGWGVLEYDSTAQMKTAKILSVVNGNNTVYTCPANTNAFILDLNAQISSIFNGGALYYSNASGGSVTRQWYFVNSGGSPGVGNSTSAATSISNSQVDSAGVTGGTLGPGDFISINTNSATATQMAWINVLEVPA